MATSRKECIEKNEVCPGLFSVGENPKLKKGEAPFYEIASFSEVDKNANFIDIAAFEKKVDPRLIRAIMFMETTHGYYDAPLSWFGKNNSILPMNINVAYWGNTFGSRQDLLDPFTNIRAGAEMLSRLQKNLLDYSIEKIATLYNHLNAGTVNDYGMRVKNIYEERPWFELSVPGFQ